jgi:hypothetical protein
MILVKFVLNIVYEINKYYDRIKGINYFAKRKKSEHLNRIFWI